MEKNYDFIVRVYNTKERKNENHALTSKAEAESFKSNCNPIQYTKPVVYPKALFTSLFGEQPIINVQS